MLDVPSMEGLGVAFLPAHSAPSRTDAVQVPLSGIDSAADRELRSKHSSDIEQRVCGCGRVQLALALRKGPFSGGSIDGNRSPPLTILVGDVNEQCVPVVLNANPVSGVAFFFQPANGSTTGFSSDE